MPRIENTSAQQYGLSAKGFEHVKVPAATKTDTGEIVNGFADVDAEMLKLVKAEAWGAAVFGCGDLIEVAATKTAPKPKATDDDEKAKTAK